MLARDVVAVPVGPPCRFAVVGSPAYFAGREKPRVPQDLAGHACIGRRYPDGSRCPWRFGRGEQSITLTPRGQLVITDAALMVAAARDGIGLAQTYEGYAAPLLDRGDLVRVLEDWCPTLSPFYLCYPGRRQVPPQFRAFIAIVRSPTTTTASPFPA